MTDDYTHRGDDVHSVEALHETSERDGEDWVAREGRLAQYGDDVHPVEAAMRDHDEGMTGWQPIETAPKDAMILLFRPTAPEWGRVAQGKWDTQKYHKRPNPYWEYWIKVGGTTESRSDAPTHWMPLPAAPTEGE
jgi:hypothetical protein